jgi:hypothetical protein
MEMGEQFEKRLLMHRNARKLDEESNRQVLQLTEEQDLLGRFVQASMHKKLAMEQQIGRQLTASDPSYKHLLDKAVDEKIAQEQVRLEQLSTSAKKPASVPLLGDGMGANRNRSRRGGLAERLRSQNEKAKFGWIHGAIR